MSLTEYSRNLLKVSITQILQIIGFESAQLSAIDILVEILERYVVLLSTTAHDFSEVANRTEPTLDDLARAFNKHRICVSDLEEFIKWVDTPEFQLKNHTNIIPISHPEHTKEWSDLKPSNNLENKTFKNVKAHFTDYLGYCEEAKNEELSQRDSDEEFEYVYDFYPLMNKPKNEIKLDETKALIESNESMNNAVESSAAMNQETSTVIKAGVKYENNTWKSMYEPKQATWKSTVTPTSAQVPPSQAIHTKEPRESIADMPICFNKPKEKLKRQVYQNALAICRKSSISKSILLIKDESLDESFSKQSSTKPQTEFEPLKFTFRRNSNKEETAQTSTPAISNEPIQVDKERDETPKTSIEPIVISKIKSSAELKTPNSASKHFDKVYEEAFNKYSQGASEKKLQTKIKSKPLITDSTSQSTVVSSSTASSNKPLNLIIKKNKTDSVFQVNKVPKLIINTSQLKDSSSKPLESSEEQFELKKPDFNQLNSFDENANDAIEFDGKDEDKNIEPIIWKPVFNTNTTNSPVASPLVQPATEMSDSFFHESSSAVATSGPLLQPFTIKKTSVDTSDTHNESTPQSDAIAHKSKKKKKLKDKHKESPEKDKDKSKKKKKKKDKDKEKEKDKEKSHSNLESSHNTSLSSSEQKKKDKKLKKLMKKEQKKAESSNKEQQQERDESHSARSTPEIKETTQKKPPNLIEAAIKMEQEQQQQQPRLKLKLKLNSNDSPNPASSSSSEKAKLGNVNKPDKKVSDKPATVQAPRPSSSMGSNIYEEAEPGEIVRPQNMSHKKSDLIPKIKIKSLNKPPDEHPTTSLKVKSNSNENVLEKAPFNPLGLPMTIATALPHMTALHEPSLKTKIKKPTDQKSDGANKSYNDGSFEFKPDLSNLANSSNKTLQKTPSNLSISSTDSQSKLIKKNKTPKLLNESIESLKLKMQTPDSLSKPKKPSQQQQQTPQSSKTYNETIFTPIVTSSNTTSNSGSFSSAKKSKISPKSDKSSEATSSNQSASVSSSSSNANSRASMKIIGKVVQEIHLGSNQQWACPACNIADDSVPMIGCDSCDDWYHMNCVGLTKAPPKNQSWYCNKCGADNG